MKQVGLTMSLITCFLQSLLRSWKFFAVEHCGSFMGDREIQKSMASVVRHCLAANAQGVTSEAIFERIQQVRVEFAQALLQHLVEAGAKGAEFFSLLGVVWETMRARCSTYEDALVSEETEYFRSLLSVLFLALQFHIDSPSRATPETGDKRAMVSSYLPQVTDIVKTVVAQGFRTLTMYLHEQPEKCKPKDFAIVTAILQTCLQVKNVDRLFEHMAFHIEDNDAARYACTLFSWADQLAIDGDPVYGELSMSFLVKLSTLPSLAEHLAVEAVLMQLSTCRLTSFIQQHPTGLGPFSVTPRLYSIWTTGILPLCLNLVYNVIRTAPEVAAFLNQFETQLSRTSSAFAEANRPASGRRSSGSIQRITLSMASEMYTLGLISFILHRLREAGPSVGMDSQMIQKLKWDVKQVREDMDFLLERRSLLRVMITATNEKEEELARQKPIDAGGSKSQNRLEERIASQLSSAVTCLEEEASSSL